MSGVENITQINVIKPKLASIRQENAILKKELEERESKFTKREKEYREIIAEIQSQLKLRVEFNEDGNHDGKDNRKNLHDKIQNNVDFVQVKTTSVLAEQEKDIIRFYNTKIKELQQKFEHENIEQGKRYLGSDEGTRTS